MTNNFWKILPRKMQQLVQAVIRNRKVIWRSTHTISTYWWYLTHGLSYPETSGMNRNGKSVETWGTSQIRGLGWTSFFLSILSGIDQEKSRTNTILCFPFPNPVISPEGYHESCWEIKKNGMLALSHPGFAGVLWGYNPPSLFIGP